MNAEEQAICGFLKQYPGTFVSVTDISRRLGQQQKFKKDRAWSRPMLRRMELDGLVESNPCGEYRLKDTAGGTTFLQALAKPNIPLGDTTLIGMVNETELKPLDDQIPSLDEQEKRVA